MDGRRAPNRAASATAADLLIHLRGLSPLSPFLVSYRSGCYEGGWEARGPEATPLGFVPAGRQVLDPALGRGREVGSSASAAPMRLWVIGFFLFAAFSASCALFFHVVVDGGRPVNPIIFIGLYGLEYGFLASSG